MRILFVMPLSYSVYPFQVASLSSFLKANRHEAAYLELILREKLEEPSREKLVEKIDSFRPHLIGISSYQLSFGWVKEITTFIKSRFNIPIIVGGYHASLAPEEVINFSAIDMICRGEGEYPLLELASRMEKGESVNNIKNIWLKKDAGVIKNEVRPLIENLDELPFMDREMFDYQKLLNAAEGDRYLAIMGSRGCPFNCSNCSNHSLKELYPNKGKYVRLRSVDNIICEINECQKKFSFDGISFEDDTFTLFNDWLKEFSRKYKQEVGLKFRCNARPENASLENMRLLKDAGCEYVSIGIESGDERVRKMVLRRNISNEQIKKAFKNARKAGLKVRSFNMVGLPCETRSSLLKTILLNFSVAPDEVQTTIYYPFKGTDLGDLCYKNNWVNKNRIEDIKVLSNDSVLDLPGLSRPEIIAAKWINSSMALMSGNFGIIKAAFKMLKI